MKKLLLVRHGQTEWNAERRIQGQIDIPLSEHGTHQARSLAPIVRALAPDYAMVSDLTRTRMTADLLGYGHAVTDSRLREQSLGSWTGKTHDELLEAEPDRFYEWRAGTFSPPGAETWEEFRHRAAVAAQEAIDRAKGVALVVCHGGVIRALIEHILEISPSRVLPVAPGSVSIINYRGSHASLEALNLSGGYVKLNSPD